MERQFISKKLFLFGKWLTSVWVHLLISSKIHVFWTLMVSTTSWLTAMLPLCRLIWRVRWDESLQSPNIPHFNICNSHQLMSRSHVSDNRLFTSLGMDKWRENGLNPGCGDGIVRGVNLGGWLVLEPWITPRFFEEVKYQPWYHKCHNVKLMKCQYKIVLEYWFETQVNAGENQDKIVDEWTHAEFLMYQDPETYVERMVNSFHKTSLC